MRWLVRVRERSDAGVASIEYALLAAFIAVAIAVAIGLLGLAVLDLFTSGVEEIPWDG